MNASNDRSPVRVSREYGGGCFEVAIRVEIVSDDPEKVRTAGEQIVTALMEGDFDDVMVTATSAPFSSDAEASQCSASGNS